MCVCVARPLPIKNGNGSKSYPGHEFSDGHIVGFDHILCPFAFCIPLNSKFIAIPITEFLEGLTKVSLTYRYFLIELQSVNQFRFQDISSRTMKSHIRRMLQKATNICCLRNYVQYSRVRSVKTQLIYCQITSVATCFDLQSHHKANLEPY